MMTFILTFAVSFVLLLTVSLFISYSKRRQRNTNHGLTGMCHETGGEMCGRCSSAILVTRRETRPAQDQSLCCDKPDIPPAVRSN